MSEPIADQLQHKFMDQLNQLKEAGPLTKNDQGRKLASTMDIITAKETGPAYLFEHIETILDAGFFKGTSWEDEAVLNASLVGGTLKSGGLNTVYEIISELRLMAISEGKIHSEAMTPKDALRFLEEITVSNLDLLFPDASEEQRNVDDETRKKIQSLFGFLRNEIIDPDRINKRLASELEMICAQRPIITDRAHHIIRTIKEQMTTAQSDDIAPRLQLFIDAVYAPSKRAAELDVDEYEAWINDEKTGTSDLEAECTALSEPLRETGLSSPYHALLLRRIQDDRHLIAKLLRLNSYGLAELETHHSLIRQIINLACHPSTNRFVYGLAVMLERNLLARQPVESGLTRLLEITIHPEVEQLVKKSRPDSSCSAQQLIVSDTICLLGQPLGIGQGWNPTCQSARGISLWSRHAPGSVLEMIDTVATANEMEMRFEGQMINSSQLTEGLAKEFDYNLDAVSVVLVPHLDLIYFEMMRRASGRADDPHKWVNPAMYGEWIPTGFTSPYSYLTNAISNYEQFLRTFYASHHPEYNGMQDLTYPNPVGIFLTAANGKLLGFHAVSILRVAKYEDEYRIYFLNPNNEGRQKWQSDIQPTVAGNGEVPGESSLPFYQFASRLYAFHFKPSDADGLDKVASDEIEKVTDIAKNSWGTSYTWLDIPLPSLY